MKQSMFNPATRLIYGLIAFEVLASLLLYGALGLRFADPALAMPSALSFIALGGAWLLRSRSCQMPADALEALGLVHLQGLAGWALLYPMAVLSGPFADVALSNADHMFGFDYSAVYAAFHGNDLLKLAYNSFFWQSVAVILALVALRKDVWRFVSALALALVVTALLYPFAPAEGPMNFYHLAPAQPHIAVIEALRDQGARTITIDMLVGMVSFPSYHTAAAVIFAWAMWPVRLLRWPFIALNGMMIFATVPIGDHYLVDVIAGAAVAIVSCALSLNHNNSLIVCGWRGRVREDRGRGPATAERC